jgi:hypothetical protein
VGPRVVARNVTPARLKRIADRSIGCGDAGVARMSVV